MGLQLTDSCIKQELVQKYFNMVYKIALSRTGDVHHAEDVVQDTFVRFLKSDKEFESEEHVKAWLIKVTVNCSKSVFLSAWYKKTAPLNEEISFDSPEKSEVYYATMALPQKYRTVIHLFYYEDMSVRDISLALGIKETTVKSQLHRGRELLKENLKGEYGDV